MFLSLSSRKASTRKAFTLLELIVVIVILGILAALAIPTFKTVIDRSSDGTTITSLESLSREAQALMAFQDGTTWDEAVESAAADLGSASPGVLAFTSVPVDGPVRDLLPVGDGVVSYQVNDAGDTVILSKQSSSGRTCFTAFTSSTNLGSTCATPDLDDAYLYDVVKDAEGVDVPSDFTPVDGPEAPLVGYRVSFPFTASTLDGLVPEPESSQPGQPSTPGSFQVAAFTTDESFVIFNLDYSECDFSGGSCEYVTNQPFNIDLTLPITVNVVTQGQGEYTEVYLADAGGSRFVVQDVVVSVVVE